MNTALGSIEIYTQVSYEFINLEYRKKNKRSIRCNQKSYHVPLKNCKMFLLLF